MTDAEPQPILTPISEAAIFLAFVVEPGAEDAVRDVLADVSGLRRSVGFRVPDAALSCVVGIGAAVWPRLFGGPRPAELHPFRPVDGATHHAPATPGDLLLPRARAPPRHVLRVRPVADAPPAPVRLGGR